MAFITEVSELKVSITLLAVRGRAPNQHGLRWQHAHRMSDLVTRMGINAQPQLFLQVSPLQMRNETYEIYSSTKAA